MKFAFLQFSPFILFVPSEDHWEQDLKPSLPFSTLNHFKLFNYSIDKEPFNSDFYPLYTLQEWTFSLKLDNSDSGAQWSRAQPPRPGFLDSSLGSTTY